MGELVHRKKFATSVDIKTLEEFKQISIDTEIPISRLTDKAMQLLIQAMKDKEFRRLIDVFD